MLFSHSSFLQAMPLLCCKEMFLKQHRISSLCRSLGNDILIGQALTNCSLKAPFFTNRRFQERRHWKTKFALDTSGIPSNGNPNDDINGDSSTLRETRLSRIVIAAGRQLLRKLNSARKNFPMKLFLLLLGFYTANALATILGQTGDWDVLVAGIVVAAIEGIGMLMYKGTMISSGRMQSSVVLINYWKAGVCFGLFVDAFKVGS